MKNIFTSVVVVFGVTLSSWAADTTVKISDVHLCCQSCVKGAQAAVGKVAGVTAAIDKDAGTVSLTGPDTATVQKAADALIAAGYFGKSSDATIKLSEATGAKSEKVQTLKVDDVHLCCASCVTAVNDALGTVAGYKANTAKKGDKTFTVTGDFNDKEIFAALQKAGLTGKVGN
jgi:copper chaperone CopZ